jgi:hypothetical protein
MLTCFGQKTNVTTTCDQGLSVGTARRGPKPGPEGLRAVNEWKTGLTAGSEVGARSQRRSRSKDRVPVGLTKHALLRLILKIENSFPGLLHGSTAPNS